MRYIKNVLLSMKLAVALLFMFIIVIVLGAFEIACKILNKLGHLMDDVANDAIIGLIGEDEAKKVIGKMN